ncbi:hypothetical protein SAMN02745121_08804, partial [Nannocystis exedens]
ICKDYVCVTPPECQVDADCDPGEICKDYVCVDPRPTCKYDSDCPDHHVCKYGKCKEICKRFVDSQCE